RKDQQAVQRRPQLVRHVRKEFRLVFGRERQLFGFLFQSAPGLLHFAVLGLDLGILLTEQIGFLFQLFVLLPQLFLLCAEQLFGFAQRFGLPLQAFVGRL